MEYWQEEKQHIGQHAYVEGRRAICIYDAIARPGAADDKLSLYYL